MRWGLDIHIDLVLLRFATDEPAVIKPADDDRDDDY